MRPDAVSPPPAVDPPGGLPGPGADAGDGTPAGDEVIVVGHGLAGLVAATELLAAGRRVALLDAEGPQDLGGQAWWSFGGLFLVDSPEQRRLRVRDSAELAWADWERTAGWDRETDDWGRRWARAYVEWAAGGKRTWLRRHGIRLFPVVGWAERGDNRGPGVENTGPGNSVPRFHITWGTGPGLVEPFARAVTEAVDAGRARLLHRHRVTELLTEGGRVVGVSADVLAPDGSERGAPSSREVVGHVELRGEAVVLATGGIGGDGDRVRAQWPARLGTLPDDVLHGVPAHVDGSGVEVARAVGAATVNADRMWAYTEGLANHAPVWPLHGIRILPGPSSLWLDSTGHRLPVPLYPGADTLGALQHLQQAGSEYSWFVANRRIIGKEFALSGSEQNPDLTGRSVRQVIGRVRVDVPAPVQRFVDAGLDVVQADELEVLLDRMEALTGDALDRDAVRAAVDAHEDEADPQRARLRDARGYLGDRLVRTVPPHRLTDPAAGPLVAFRLRVLTRKTLGGLLTDLDGRVLDAQGQPVPGLFAAGEATGFGGGGVHGYRSLEGTFLGGCLFTGRRAAAGVIAQR
ncbi:FAD-binding dehydrogenase [Kytococcus sedentarius]|uniref:FAD-binding dehydrogenase n=1 Tax=Kytococcus sedentarius TaxID=1276 RepID=UPI0035BC8FB7